MKSREELDAAVIEAADKLNSYYPPDLLARNFSMGMELPRLADAIDELLLAVRARREAMRPHKAEALWKVVYDFGGLRSYAKTWSALDEADQFYWRSRLAEILAAPDEE